MNFSKYIFYFSLFLIIQNTALSQIFLDNWKSYSSLVYTQDTDIDDNGRIWVATSGGVYSLMYDGSDIHFYRNINEMIDIETSVIKYNPFTEELYVGTKNGYIDILDKNGNWTHISDIKNQKFSTPQINDIVFYGDKAFFAGEFGLAVFDVNEKVFYETINKFLDISRPAIKSLAIFNEKIFVLTNTNNIFSADVNSALSFPQNWYPYEIESAENSGNLSKLFTNDGEFFAFSGPHIYKLSNDTFNVYKQKGVDDFISIYYSKETDFIYANYFGIINSKNQSLLSHRDDLIYGIQGFNINGKTGLIVRYEKKGIGIIFDDEYQHILPNTPLSNVSRDLALDKSGNLWIATDEDPNGRGIAKFDGQSWKNYTVQDYPILESDNYYRITVGNDGRIVASNYGKGLLILEPDGDDYTLQRFNDENSVLYGLPSSGTYIVCGKPRFDSKNNIWVPILGNRSNGPAIVCFDKEYNSYGYENTRDPNSRYFSSLAIDRNDTKWIGGSRVEGLGMLYYNEKGKLDNHNDYYSGFITQSDHPNMPDNTQNTIEVDRSGYVWIGTPRGLAVITSPGSVMQNSPSLNVRNLNRLIGEQAINYIMIDPQNNKWLATNNGVWIINSDGSDTVGIINRKNSLLPTDEVISLASNPATGQIYFGTKLGIYEANSLFIQASHEYDINCYPQPFNSNKHKQLFIEGLEEFSDIRIVSTSGDLVRKIFTNSNKVIWDGRDENGNIVPTGVYLVLASSAASKNSSVQKIAVVNN